MIVGDPYHIYHISPGFSRSHRNRSENRQARRERQSNADNEQLPQRHSKASNAARRSGMSNSSERRSKRSEISRRSGLALKMKDSNGERSELTSEYSPFVLYKKHM